MTWFKVRVELAPYGSRYRAIVSTPVPGKPDRVLGRVVKDTERLAVAAAWDQARADVVDELCPHSRAIGGEWEGSAPDHVPAPVVPRVIPIVKWTPARRKEPDEPTG